MHKKKFEAYSLALNRFQSYEKWVTFSTDKLDELLLTDSELRTGGRENPCTDGLSGNTRFILLILDAAFLSISRLGGINPVYPFLPQTFSISYNTVYTPHWRVRL